MPRIRIDLPETFDFSTDLRVRIGDVNYGGHLGNDALLSLLHEARVRFLNGLGFSEGDAGGAGIIMTDAAIVYRAEAFQGETLRIDIAVGELTRHGCDFIYRVTNRETGKEVARAKTGIVFFDYRRRKIVRVPDAFRARLRSPASA
jgi:acyl-CoA thioesterase FadM